MTKKNLLKGLTLPSNTDYKIETDEKNGGEYAKITAYPFDRGFGTTIGNTLRRILLSSIQGYAVSAIMFTVRKDGKTTQISNEFESLPGVKEDILEIIASLKQLNIKVDTENAASIQFVITCKGPGTITGKDFEKNGVTITNPDLLILTMEKDVDMDLEVQIDWGRGYISCDQKEEYKEQFGVIAVDSIFSPVKRVNYSVEPVRVGRSSEYDKLILEVYTNGTIKASEAVAQAACLAQKYLEAFINFDKKVLLESSQSESTSNDELLGSAISELGLASSTVKSLERKGFNVIQDLVSKTEAELVKADVSASSIEKIKEKLAEKGLSLGEVNTRLIRS